MPASLPAFSVEIEPAIAWDRTVAALALAAVLATLAWGWLTLESGVAPSYAMLALASAAIVPALWSLRRASRRCWLLCAGPVWRLGAADESADSGPTGTLSVTLDGGAWMLLRWHADAAPRWRRTTWLAVCRRDMPASWHALRCAVYSPRPAPAGPAAAVSADPPE